MSTRQRWTSAWLCLCLTLLVLFAGGETNYLRPTPVFAASALADHLSPAAPARDVFPSGLIVLDNYRPDRGATMEELRLEAEQIAEMKKEARELAAAQKSPQQYLLASRSIHLAEYAKFEKARRGHLIAQQAQHFLGKPYVWGGTNPNGFDCSGFTQYVYLQFGVQVPRNSYDQYQVGKTVNKTELQPGDLVFFSTYAPGPSHLGIYIGEGKFVHALNQDTGVITSTLDADYYRDRFLGGKRVL